MLELIRLLFNASWESARTWAGEYDIKQSVIFIGITSVVATVVAEIYFGQASGWARKIIVGVIGAILGPVLLFCILFLISLYYAPSTVLTNIKQTAREEQKNADQAELKSLQERLAAVQERNRLLVQRIPMPSLTEQQKSDLIMVLAVLPRQTVSIEYLDDPVARNGAVVQILEEVFLKANWHVVRHPRTLIRVFNRGLTIRLESGRPTTSEAVVQGAFSKAQITLNSGCCPEWPRDKSADVELIVGEVW